ncbi:MAG: Cof-type HAD-IIB family hydrolase [Clostridia bacterium]|nr:Cof-type HAD-IIB family hydrolase [Clostridia bacterium]
MNIKLVASDLDGTLLDDSYQVPQDVKNTVKAMVNKGVAIAIATGRMHRSAINAAKQLKTDVPIISYNGAMIKRAFSGEVLRHVTMPEDKAKIIVDLAMAKDLPIHVYINDELFVPAMTPLTEWYQKAATVKAIVYPDLNEAIDNFGSPTKIVIASEPEILEKFRLEAKVWVGNSLYITKSHRQLLEFLAADAGKGEGVAMIANSLGISKEEILCIGDNLNDLSLFDAGAVKIAMGNAAEELKAAATWVTCNREDGGWCAAMKKFVL